MDWHIQNEGNIFLFRPLTPEAEAFGVEHFPEDALTFGGAYVVEHRFAADIAADLLENGFDVGPKASPEARLHAAYDDVVDAWKGRH